MERFDNLDVGFHHYRKRILVYLSCFVLVCNVAQVSSALPEEYLPQIEILEIVSSPLNRSTSVNLWKEKNSDVVIGEDTSATSRILMKCNATYPVQWVYLGDGKPEFTTFTNVRWQEDPNEQMSFEAEASLGLLGFHGVLREEDTGNYTCRSIQEPSVHSYYYIYVPGDGLFAAGNGTNITYTPQDQFVRIPCGVSHPKVTASLCKRDKNDKMTCPVNGATSFNAKGGFLVNLKKQRDPSGTYVCTANYKRTVRIVEHNLMKEGDRPKPKPPSPVDPPPTYNPVYKPGKNLCDPSPCGKMAECSVVDGRAVCYCFRGLNGNPYDECAPGRCRSGRDCPRGKFCRQGQCTSDPCNPSPCGKGGECTIHRGQSKCACQRGYTGLAPNCVKSCNENYECSEDEACIKQICQSPCPGPCGQNAECRVLVNGNKRTAQCSCPAGLIGDPLKSCYKFNSTTPGPWNTCPPGYIGHPPTCTRRECNLDSDCPYNRKCSNNICEKGANPACNDKCGHFAECQIAPGTNDAVCVCPAGTTGNPLVVCTSSTNPSPYPTSWGNPCNPNPCQGPAECRVIQGNRVCQCPAGFYGDPANCIPTTAAYPPSSSPTGSNQPCRYDAECRHGENCLEGRCQDPCNGLCGYNAICEPAYQRKYRSIFSSGKMLRSQQPESTCTCPIGHEGNPYVSCIPIRDGPPPPPALPSSTTPAEPICFPSPCGRYAECTPINGAPLCRCLEGYEGNPYQECRYPVISPSSPGGPPDDDRFSRPPPPGRATPISPTDLDFQGHSWGHHTDLNLNDRDRFPQSPDYDKNYYEPSPSGPGHSRPPPFGDRPPPPSDRYPLPQSPSFDDESAQSSPAYPQSPSSSRYPPDYSRPPPTQIFVEDNPTPKTLGRPMSPISPMDPPFNDRDECSFRNPYADYDMDSCGVGRRCERDFRGIKRCVCISPFDCTGPTSNYNHRGKCQTNRDCLLSDHTCINGTCRNPCSPEYSPCAGIAFSECRVIEGNVLCTCRRGYVGNPASGLDCRPKRASGSAELHRHHNNHLSSVALTDNQNRDFILIHYQNGSDLVIDVNANRQDRSHNNDSSVWSSESYNDGDESDSSGSSGSNPEENDDDADSDVIISEGSTAISGTAASRHHRRHDTNQLETTDKKVETKDLDDLLMGHCGFGSGFNCDEKSHCRIFDGTPMCVCKSGYVGEFPDCKPECKKNEDCPKNMACQYHQCMDPCMEEKTYCAVNAFCRVANHTAECVCEQGTVGVPWIECTKIGALEAKGDCMGFDCEKRNALNNKQEN